MEKKQVTREKLIGLMAKFIKDCKKSLGDRTNAKLAIDIENWCSGFGRDSKWSHTDIILGSTTYTFTDRKIEVEEFIRMLKTAIAQSKVRAEVFYQECGDGFWCKKETYFKRVEIFANPCKEFNSLRNYVEKYGRYTIGDTDIYNVNICGKRDSYSDTGRYRYLCYDAKTCKAMLDTLRKFRGSKDTLKVTDVPYTNRGDETDYRIAQYQESEWYGYRGTGLSFKVTSPSGKVKLDKQFYV